MPTLQHQHSFNFTRAISSWSVELLMNVSGGKPSWGKVSPSASRGLLRYCSLYAKTARGRSFRRLDFGRLDFGQLELGLGKTFSQKRAETSNTQIMASDCDLVRSVTHGRRQIEHTLAPHTFLQRRFQLNQGMLPVEFDRASAVRRKQSP